MILENMAEIPRTAMKMTMVMMTYSNRLYSPIFLPILLLTIVTSLVPPSSAIPYDIKVFSKSTCPPCIHFKRHVEERHIPVTVFNMDDYPELRPLLERTCMSKKTPFVFINNRCTGNYESTMTVFSMIDSKRRELSNAIKRGDLFELARLVNNTVDPNLRTLDTKKNAWEEMLAEHQCHPEMVDILDEVTSKNPPCRINGRGLNVDINLDQRSSVYFNSL